ncbi:MAG: RagB/SusD family nutrient uptake outer membrane protein [Rikenellaceae bacterium]|nr:RagB/SusD family nutrient uptake outer membrane protein [Rikenellaceae bacterium]
MKRYINSFKTWIILLAVISAAGMWSCTESAFNRYPLDDFTEDKFFVDETNVNQMLVNAYSSTRSVYAYYYYVADISADDTYNSKFNNSSDHITINEANVMASNGALANLWTYSYTVISRVHLVLENAEIIEMDADLKKRYQNEAKYLRALMYFNLVRIFGDVPLVLEDVKDEKELFEYGREPKENIYKQIIQDLTDALELPARYDINIDIGRATSTAAKALLGEVYLTLKDYDSALGVLRELVDGNTYGYRLLDDYADIFDADNPNNDEIVFAIQYARGYDSSMNMSNSIVSGTFPNEDMTIQIGSGIIARGTGTYLLTRDLYREFDPADERLSMIETMTGTRKNYIFMLKYYDFGMTSRIDSGCNWIVHRWADVLLMYAEALNETGSTNDALQYVTQVRTRAGLTTDPAIASGTATMREAIAQERRLELYGEGHRWFDLIRTGKAIEVMNAHFSDPTLDNDEIGENSKMEEYKLLFPIPVDQVLLNPDKIKQNEGY